MIYWLHVESLQTKSFFWIYILFFALSYMFINILENRGKVLNDIQGMLQQMRFSSWMEQPCDWPLYGAKRNGSGVVCFELMLSRRNCISSFPSEDSLIPNQHRIHLMWCNLKHGAKSIKMLFSVIVCLLTTINDTLYTTDERKIEKKSYSGRFILVEIYIFGIWRVQCVNCYVQDGKTDV